MEAIEIRDGISPEYRKAILLDIIVCGNHCGKLSIAHHAIRALTRILGVARHPLRDFSQVVKTLVSGKENPIRELNASLNEYSKLMVAASTTYFREGDLRMAHQILEQQIGDTLYEIEKADVAIEPPADMNRQRRDHISGVLVSYRRIIAKYGQMCSALGKLTEAEAAYTVAEKIENQRLSGSVAHRGESGRNYVRMLATYRQDDKGTMARIHAIVDANISFSAERNRHHEVLEWYVERAWLALAANRSDQIKDSLDAITKLTNEHQLQVSYVALREIELLSLLLRHKLNGRANRRDLNALIQTLRRSRHKLLLLEALRCKQLIDAQESEAGTLNKEISDLLISSGANPKWLRV